MLIYRGLGVSFRVRCQGPGFAARVLGSAYFFHLQLELQVLKQLLIHTIIFSCRKMKDYWDECRNLKICKHHKVYNFSKNYYDFHTIVIFWYWHYFQKIRTVKIKGIFFYRFDIALLAEPWKFENTWMCQLSHVGRLRVNGERTKKFCNNFYIHIDYIVHSDT